jgi:hypothetical protein
MNEIDVIFPKRYKPLPNGFRVFWSEYVEHYLGYDEKEDVYSPIFSCRFAARRWCFEYEMNKEWGKR